MLEAVWSHQAGRQWGGGGGQGLARQRMLVTKYVGPPLHPTPSKEGQEKRYRESGSKRGCNQALELGRGRELRTRGV